MSTKCNQISLPDIFNNCQDMFLSNSPTFFSLLEENLDISDFIPLEFYNAFYKTLGRKREYQLSAFLFQKIVSIPTDSLLIVLLHLCKELRDFCGFKRVPDASKFTLFKQDFLPYLEQMFTSLVDYTEPICQTIDSSLASMITFDTTGIELYVTENNPKTLNALIKKLKSYYKNKPDVDPYKMAYGLMPSQATSSPDAKQMYINGHFCYADKLGIIRHISFFDEPFKELHPALIVDKKSDSPDEDKSIGDSSALKPVLQDFFSLHPNCQPDTFLGDSAFDTIETYTFLQDEFHFSKAAIPYNSRNENTLKKVGYNEYGYPVCPNDSSLAMKLVVLTGTNGAALKCVIKKGSGFVNVKNLVHLPKRDVLLILMKTWHFVYSPESNAILMQGETLQNTCSSRKSNQPF